MSATAARVTPGLVGRWGRDLLHCPYCHGWEVRDEPLAVLGSLEHALLVRQWTDDLTFLPHTLDLTDADREQLGRRGIRVVEGPVRRALVEDDRLVGAELEDGTRVDCTAVFIRPELRPRLLGLDVELDELGFVRVDAFGRTSVPGLYAAGNVANPRAQVITAAGEGSAAAIALNNDLVQEDSR